MALIPKYQHTNNHHHDTDDTATNTRKQGSQQHPLRHPQHPTGLNQPNNTNIQLHQNSQGHAPKKPNQHQHKKLKQPKHPHLPNDHNYPTGNIRTMETTNKQPTATPTHHTKPQPQRLIPNLPTNQNQPIHNIPIPNLLLPNQPQLQPTENQFHLPTIQPQHHHQHKHRIPTPTPTQPAPTHTAKSNNNHHKHAITHPNNPTPTQT